MSTLARGFLVFVVVVVGFRACVHGRRANGGTNKRWGGNEKYAAAKVYDAESVYGRRATEKQ